MLLLYQQTYSKTWCPTHEVWLLYNLLMAGHVSTKKQIQLHLKILKIQVQMVDQNKKRYQSGQERGKLLQKSATRMWKNRQQSQVQKLTPMLPALQQPISSNYWHISSITNSTFPSGMNIRIHFNIQVIHRLRITCLPNLPSQVYHHPRFVS